jgi:hypothetical protein
MLPGSRSDQLPLVLCVNCERRKERGGGVSLGDRFVCRACFTKFVLAGRTPFYCVSQTLGSDKRRKR